MWLPTFPVIIAILLPITVQAADSKAPKVLKPCTITSPTSGLLFDLNDISIQPPSEKKKSSEGEKLKSWTARGYDYGVDSGYEYGLNFTMNFCAPVVEPLEDVVGIDEELWRNVSAYYVQGKKTYSIGQLSSEPVIRGRKLVLNYTMGSPCDSSTKKRREIIDDDDKDGRKDHEFPKSGSDKMRRKSSIISLLCDKDPLAKKTEASVAFVAASPDECTYVFEARSAAACGGTNIAQQAVGPGGVFGIIVLIAAAVYVIGGIAYQRTVMHQRGWRQLPNYSIWAGIASFIKDMFIIATSSCARFLPYGKGYNQLPSHSDSRNGSSRGSRAEDENRLIDQLDEEWDD